MIVLLEKELADLGVQLMNDVIIALDQSTSISGYSVYKNNSLIDYGHLSPSGDYLHRIVKLVKWLDSQIDKYFGDKITVLIEEIQLQQTPDSKGLLNVETFKKLAHCQGALLEYLVEHEIPYLIIPSSTWKSKCGVKGKGRVEQKKNAQLYVEKEFGIKATQDEADAICIGKSHVLNLEDNFNWE